MAGGQLGNNGHEGSSEHAEVLQPLLVPSALSPVAAVLTSHELQLDGMEVLPEHHRISGVQKGLGFISQVTVVSQFQVTWLLQGMVSSPMQEARCLEPRLERTTHSLSQGSSACVGEVGSTVGWEKRN